MNHEFTTPEPIDLDVELGEGHVQVSAEAVETTSVSITGPRSDRFTVTQDGRHIRIAPAKGPSWRLGSHQIRVVLPRSSNLVIGCGSASIEVAGQVADVSIHSGSGQVRCERADTLSVSTGSGSITAGLARVVNAKSGSGEISIGHLGESAKVTTGSGQIVADRVHGDFAAKSGSGSLWLGSLDGDLHFATGSGGTEVRRALRGRIDVRSASGAVRIGVESGTPVWTDVSSIVGGVESRLEPTGEPAEGQTHLEVRVHTVSGAVRLEPATTPGEKSAPQDAVYAG